MVAFVQAGFHDEGALPRSSSIRAAYINTGSRDVGPDLSSDNPYLSQQRVHRQRLEEAERKQT